MIDIHSFDECECACEGCQDMCKRVPCRPTVLEAEKLINAGYGPRLMVREQYVSDPDDYAWVLMPASVGNEGKPMRSYWQDQACVFFHNGHCDLHSLGLKPLEGRVARHDKRDLLIDDAIGKDWLSPRGRSLVRAWKQVMGLDPVPTLEEQPA